MQSTFKTLAAVLAVFSVGTAVAQLATDFVPKRTEFGHPDFQGSWKNNTATPLERPVALGNKRSYSESEVAAILDRTLVQQNSRSLPSDPDRGAPPVGEIITNVADANFLPDLYDVIAQVNGEYRTSLIIAPENGRLPRRDNAKDFYQQFFDRGFTPFDDVKLRPANERCLANPGQLPVTMPIPPGDSRTLKIIQTEDYVVIFGEYATALRIIPLTSEFPENPWPFWRGVSIGKWEDNKLVIHSKHFRPELSHWRLPASGSLEVVEELELLGPEKLLYRYTFTDPEVFTEPFTAELPLQKMAADEYIYESACHEGNYALRGVLAGARRADVDAEFNTEPAQP